MFIHLNLFLVSYLQLGSVVINTLLAAAAADQADQSADQVFKTEDSSEKSGSAQRLVYQSEETTLRLLIHMDISDMPDAHIPM